MAQYIKNLINEGEHQRLDFKFEISDSRKIAKTLVAFANTDGGTLLIGVKDNGKIAGVRSDEEIYMVEAAANLYCSPKVEIHFRRWDLEGKVILEVLVPKSEQSPHYADIGENKKMIYIRVADENILANSIHIKVWKRKQQNNGVYIEFTDKEKILLKHLESHDNISLSKFCKLALVTRKSGETILANLISLNIIRMVYADGHFVFQFKK